MTPAECICDLLVRASYNEDLNESHGPSYWRSREVEATRWAAAELAEVYPHDAMEGLALADQRIATRRARMVR